MDNHAVAKAWYKQTASRITVAAHFFGILASILMLIWLLHYLGGLQYYSDDANLVFNCHPFFMFIGFVFISGEAMMAFKTVRAKRPVPKFVHMILNLIAICLGIAGICAAFKFHNMEKIKNMYSLHSWIGLATFCLFGLQWLFGFYAFVFPKASNATRARLVPWHIWGGRAIMYMEICTALTGLLEKSTFLQSKPNDITIHEERLINFTGLAVLLFGISVDLSIALARYCN